MKLTKETCKIISALEYIIGSQCYNSNSYNGWTGEYGCSFRYPVYVTRKVDDRYIKNKVRSRALVTKETIDSIEYRFGSNHLSIGKGIADVLDFLSDRYELDFDELEKEYLDSVKE